MIDNCLGSFGGGFVDQDLLELEVGNKDSLGVSLVSVRVEFDALFAVGGPVGIVDIVAVSNFGFNGFPVGNSTIEVAPSAVDIRVFELTVEDEVVVGVGRGKSHVVDVHSEVITEGSTIELEDVVTSFKLDVESGVVNGEVSV